MSTEKEDLRYISSSIVTEEVTPKSYAVIAVNGKCSNEHLQKQRKEEAQRTLYLNRI
jgi:hypothetical protein